MNDRNRDSKKQRITYTATNEGIERANRALARDFGSKATFHRKSLVSRSTITKFFSQKPIQLDCFQQICEELQLSDWQEIAGIKPTEQLTRRKIDSLSNTYPDESGEPVQTLTRQITITDEEKNTILAIITLKGDIESAPNKEIFETILREHSGKAIKIIDKKEGSIKLVIEGSPEDIKHIESLIKSKEVTELSGFPIEEIEIIDASSDSQETSKPNKWSLVKEIISQPVQGRDLKGADLSDANLSGANLSFAYLIHANLSDANLSFAYLIHANLSFAYLIHANLSGADLSGANLSGANLSFAYLIHANLSDANLSGADLSGADLRDANLRGSYIRNTIIDSSTKLDRKWHLVWKIVNDPTKKQNLRDADLRDADLRDANLSGANLRSANLRSANLRSANLSGANLSGANLRSANLSGANLRGSYIRNTIIDSSTKLDRKWHLVWKIVNDPTKKQNLRDADLRDANLSGADLRSADLKSADLRSANLRSADLRSADLRSADLRSANLRSADLSGAKVENARFGYNQGISDNLRQDLITRGAKFEDSPGDRSKSLTHV